MICYKDRTFCSSEKHKPECDRQITLEEMEHAKEIGLPIAFSDFCKDEENIN